MCSRHFYHLKFDMIEWNAPGIVVFVLSMLGIIALVVFGIPLLGTRPLRAVHYLLIVGHVICIAWTLSGVLDAYSPWLPPSNVRFTLGLQCAFLLLQIHFEILKMFRVLTTISETTIPRLQWVCSGLFVMYLSTVLYTTWHSSRAPWDQVIHGSLGTTTRCVCMDCRDVVSGAYHPVLCAPSDPQASQDTIQKAIPQNSFMVHSISGV
jgi:hypothetical protein